MTAQGEPLGGVSRCTAPGCSSIFTSELIYGCDQPNCAPPDISVCFQRYDTASTAVSCCIETTGNTINSVQHIDWFCNCYQCAQIATLWECCGNVQQPGGTGTCVGVLPWAAESVTLTPTAGSVLADCMFTQIPLTTQVPPTATTTTTIATTTAGCRSQLNACRQTAVASFSNCISSACGSLTGQVKAACVSNCMSSRTSAETACGVIWPC